MREVRPGVYRAEGGLEAAGCAGIGCGIVLLWGIVFAVKILLIVALVVLGLDLLGITDVYGL